MRKGKPALHHVALGVSDVTRVAAFYRDVLHLGPARRATPDVEHAGSDADGAGPGGASTPVDAGGASSGRSAGDASTSADSGGAPQAGSVWLALGDAILMIEPGPPAAPRALVLAIDRAAREVWRARLAAAGHPVTDETRFTLYARDPAGNRVGLSHWPDEA
ncbi:MAG TPA: VOC family protein [Myxococcota bacterium]|jgi:catechol 2,3-dioxygenase-like lactoylglutathione lyase family enzyme|nr:VOC family protein [Myxococcota bacterium]